MNFTSEGKLLKIHADSEKISHLSNTLFGASPIQLPLEAARRLAKKHAAKALAAYRADCRAALIRKGLIKEKKWIS